MFCRGTSMFVRQKKCHVTAEHGCVCVFFFPTCLFVWASDELIGAGADWLLLREGGNFSVILWLIIALKYVTVPTPSEVFLTGSFDVCSHEAGGQTRQAILAPTPREATAQVLSTSLLHMPVCCTNCQKNKKTTTLCCWRRRERWGKWQDSSAWNCQERLRRRVLCRGDWSADGLFLENVSPKKQKV